MDYELNRIEEKAKSELGNLAGIKPEMIRAEGKPMGSR